MKKSFASGALLEALAARYPTPFYLYDEAGIRETSRRVMAAFSWNPGHRQFFAVKATPNPAILKILREEGGGAACASAPELTLAKMAGFTGGDVLFAPNFPPPADVAAAAELGAAPVLDGEYLLDFFEKRGALRGIPGLRYNPGGDFAVAGKKVSSPGGTKFGFTGPQMAATVRRLRQMGFEGFGIFGYMGGNIMETGYYAALTRLLIEAGLEAERAGGLPLTYINLSGGVGVAYRPEEEIIAAADLGRSVRAVYNEYFGPAGGPAVYTELSRYITAPHGILVSRVIHKKSAYREFLGLDASAQNLMRPMLYGAYHHITIAGKEDAPCDRLYDVVGSIPEGIDRFAENRALPETEIGDLAVIHDCGAHGHAMGYNYGGKLRCAELLLKENGEAVRIRRAETEADYLATLAMP